MRPRRVGQVFAGPPESAFDFDWLCHPNDARIIALDSGFRWAAKTWPTLRDARSACIDCRIQL